MRDELSASAKGAWRILRLVRRAGPVPTVFVGV